MTYERYVEIQRFLDDLNAKLAGRDVVLSGLAMFGMLDDLVRELKAHGRALDYANQATLGSMERFTKEITWRPSHPQLRPLIPVPPIPGKP